MPQGPDDSGPIFRSNLVVAVTAVLLIAGLTAGCDDRSDTPPPIDLAPKKPPVAVRPTTQQIMTAPRKLLKLFTFPLTLEVPNLPLPNRDSPQWKIGAGNDISPTQWVEGPAPSGDVMIQMARLPESPTAATIQGIENATRKEIAAKPETALFLSIRTLGPIRIIEQRTLRHLPAQDTEDPKPGSATGEMIHTDRKSVV